MPKRTSQFLVLLAIGFGLLIAWIDSRPKWDDSGITAGLLLLAAGIFGLLRPARPWLWGLAVGAWVPLLGIGHRNLGALLALAPALFGAYAGAFLRKALGPPAKDEGGS